MIWLSGTQRGVCGCPAHFDWAEKKLTGATEVKWVNTSWKELRWEERDERKVEERCQNLRQELKSSAKMMEVWRSSCRQNLFLDPIAVHFLNLETSATRLARDLLVYIYIYIYRHRQWFALLFNMSSICFTLRSGQLVFSSWAYFVVFIHVIMPLTSYLLPLDLAETCFNSLQVILVFFMFVHVQAKPQWMYGIFIFVQEHQPWGWLS